MAHESFEDDATAAQLNDGVRLRQGRPRGAAGRRRGVHGGDGRDDRPGWLADDRGARPRRQPVLHRHLLPRPTAWRAAGVAAGALRTDRGLARPARRRTTCGRVACATTSPARSRSRGHALTADDLDAAVAALASDFDRAHGGFGGAPKFPPSMVLELLRRRPDHDESRRMLDRTLEAMARGGIHDQLAGGFARYSVDAAWVVPHFEKMLYDNAQLVGLYARWGTPLGDRVAAGTADWMLARAAHSRGRVRLGARRRQRGRGGALLRLDPGAAGRRPRRGRRPLGDRAVRGHRHLRARQPRPSSFRATPTTGRRFDDVRRRLLAAREQRVRPERDDKVVAAWNGLAICGLVDAGRLLGREEYVDAALAAGELLAGVHLVDGRLRRVSRDGRAGRPAGVLEDYGAVAGGLPRPVRRDRDERWLARATDLLDAALTHFRADDGGFFDTPSDGERLVARPRDPGDNASPSGTSATIHALLAAHALTGDGRWRDAADEALAGVSELARRAPRFAGLVPGGRPGSASTARRRSRWSARPARARRSRASGAPLAGCRRRRRGGPGDAVPLLEGRGPVDGTPAAYVCRATFVTVRCHRLANSFHPLDADLTFKRPRPGGSGEPKVFGLGGPAAGDAHPVGSGAVHPADEQLVDDVARIAESVSEVVDTRAAMVSRGHRRRVARGHDRGRGAVVRARRRAPLAPFRPGRVSSQTPSSWAGSTRPSAARCPTSRCRPTCPQTALYVADHLGLLIAPLHARTASSSASSPRRARSTSPTRRRAPASCVELYAEQARLALTGRCTSRTCWPNGSGCPYAAQGVLQDAAAAENVPSLLDVGRRRAGRDDAGAWRLGLRRARARASTPRPRRTRERSPTGSAPTCAPCSSRMVGTCLTRRDRR